MQDRELQISSPNSLDSTTVVVDTNSNIQAKSGSAPIWRSGFWLIFAIWTVTALVPLLCLLTAFVYSTYLGNLGSSLAQVIGPFVFQLFVLGVLVGGLATIVFFIYLPLYFKLGKPLRSEKVVVLIGLVSMLLAIITGVVL